MGHLVRLFSICVLPNAHWLSVKQRQAIYEALRLGFSLACIWWHYFYQVVFIQNMLYIGNYIEFYLSWWLRLWTLHSLQLDCAGSLRSKIYIFPLHVSPCVSCQTILEEHADDCHHRQSSVRQLGCQFLLFHLSDCISNIDQARMTWKPMQADKVTRLRRSFLIISKRF